MARRRAARPPEGARIELLRREERLEQSTLTGTQTLLVLMNDVRVGDAVDIAYTCTARIRSSRAAYADNYQLNFGSPADVVQVRIDHPGEPAAARQRHPRRRDAGDPRAGRSRVLRMLKRDVPMVRAEENVPPWYKVWPSVHVSEYAEWSRRRALGRRLVRRQRRPRPGAQARIDAWRAQTLPREQLAAAVLEAVQDEVRYFSLSLGESSHRPKAPALTFAERLGDCKDKVALLNAVLQRLGFDATAGAGVAAAQPRHRRLPART